MIADSSPVVAAMVPMSMVVPMSMNPYVKICQDKKTRKPIIPPPKRIRDPRVEICIIRRRSIVGNHRWTLAGIIIADTCGVGILGAGRIPRVTTGGIHLHIQIILGYSVLKCV
jgi:hypothetical protein